MIIIYFHIGFALFFLVLFVLFVVAWEKYLRRGLEFSIGRISKTGQDNSTWNRIEPLVKRYSW